MNWKDKEKAISIIKELDTDEFAAKVRLTWSKKGVYLVYLDLDKMKIVWEFTPLLEKEKTIKCKNGLFVIKYTTSVMMFEVEAVEEMDRFIKEESWKEDAYVRIDNHFRQNLTKEIKEEWDIISNIHPDNFEQPDSNKNK